MKPLISIAFILFIASCSTTRKQQNPITEYVINSNHDTPLSISLQKGSAYNHPTFVIWIEAIDGTFASTLFMTQSFATQKYGQAYLQGNTWSQDSGKSVRPASLPYYTHKAHIDIQNNQHIVEDAISGATPITNSIIKTSTPNNLNTKFRILIEVNQAWDWNNYWTNNKYPNNFEYKTSCQPSIIYAATIDTNSSLKEYILNPIGHGHYAGEDGLLYTDLSTLTTALDIFSKIQVTLK